MFEIYCIHVVETKESALIKSKLSKFHLDLISRQVFDTKGKGWIDEAELRRCLTTIGDRLTTEEVSIFYILIGYWFLYYDKYVSRD